jgi:signal transduction histidine kinase
MIRAEAVSRLKTQLFFRSTVGLLLAGTLGFGGTYLLQTSFGQKPTIASLIGGAIFVITGIAACYFSTRTALKPIHSLLGALDHVTDNTTNSPAPDIYNQTIGKDLLQEMQSRIYELASKPKSLSTPESSNIPLSKIFDRSSVGIISLDKEQNIRYCNNTMHQYATKPDDLIGSKFFDQFDLWFADDNTFEKWLSDSAQNQIKSEQSWQNILLHRGEDLGTRFDLVANYSKNDSDDIEVLIAIIDQSESHSKDDQYTSYVAMAVHELRTPITIIRGYIEALEDEPAVTENSEMMRFVNNMKASSQQLTIFTTNILNIARIDDNQMGVKIKADSWPFVLANLLKDIDLRAKVRGKTITRKISLDMPMAAIDPLAIYEVVNNLIENAIKYGGNSPEIIVSTYLKDGMIETTVQDFGIGIPSVNLKNMFTKFYRSHHSRGTVSGTGLGLYICKKIVEAHKGRVWVESKEGQGSTFGFSLMPYDDLAKQTYPKDGTIEQGVHGWIQNHTLFRK